QEGVPHLASLVFSLRGTSIPPLGQLVSKSLMACVDNEMTLIWGSSHFSANACLAPICSLHHVAVTTVEGIGSTKSRLHPVQERIAKSHGSQCGFCTPGIVMSMYTLLRNQPEPTIEEIEDAFQGTGLEAQPKGSNSSWGFAEVREGPQCQPGMDEVSLICSLSQQITLSPSLFNPEEFTPLDPTQEPIFPPELLRLKDTPQKQLRFEGERVTWIQASTLQELLDLKAQDPEAKLVVGNTEIGEIKHGRGCVSKCFLNCEGNRCFSVHVFPGISFGASCPLSFVEKTLLDAVTNLPAHQTEVFKGVLEQLRWFAGKQVKSVAVSPCSGALKAEVMGPFVTRQMLGALSHLLLSGSFWNEELLQNVCAGLAEELSLAPDAPGGMVEFRRTLTLSFFFKFYLTVLQKLGIQNSKDCGKLDPTHASATLLFQKDPPANVQLFQEVPKGQCEEDMVGRPLPHLAAAMQASGEAVYCDDIPRYENELSLRLVTSTRAHAKIKSIDTSEAQKVPGFVCFISADDVPGSNITGIGNDEMVTCIGHIIGAVVTDTREHAQRAAQAVRITYEDLPAIITIEDAIAKDSFYEPELKIEKGNLTKGFSEADNIVSGELYIGGQEHFYLETHCTIAVPKGEAGEMELFVSTQNTTKTQSFVANMLGVPANRILVRVKRMGGGFGGKETRSTVVSTAVALAAYKTGRPVRCMLDRDEDMLITGGRHPFLARYKVGFMKTGRVVALKVEHYSNAGNTLDLSQSVTLFHMDNCYNIPNIRGTGRMCKTNLPSNTAFRGFGGPQGMFIAEHWMSEVAVTCGLPAEEVRRKNMYKEGDLTHFNQKLEGFTLSRCWEECLASSQYHARKREVDKFNEENCWKKRGLSVLPTKFGISFTVPFLNQAGALVHVYTDGSVLLTHGGTEMGQGLHTKMVQVASRTLKIPTSKIYISETSTNTVPNTSPTAASVSTDLNGQAVYEACQTILKRLEPFKKKNPSGSWEDWVTAAYLDAVSLSATGFYKTPNLGYSFETNSGNPFHYFSYGVACSEVEIDCLTGDHKNLRTDIVMDVGSSLNPAIDIGQVEGAFVQGLGLFTLEELHYSPEGSLHTRGPSTYKIPAFGSIPSEFRVSLLRDCPNKKAIYASKAVGEPPLFLAASIFFAIKDAIHAARAGNPDCKTKKLFQLNSPATPEKIRNACVDQFTRLV
uniref:xanthine dehydrogenase n=1 Tax=Lynx canadensis TaxID=61383 RepID=A0A667GIK6_LYNCA